MLSVDAYLEQLQEAQAKANKANQERLKEMMALYDDIIKSYQPGGSFGKGVESQIEEGRKKAISQGAQALAGRGFANSTMMAQLGNTYEKEVAAPTRLNLESLRAEKLAAAQAAKASALERVQDIGPDENMIAQLLSQKGASGPTRTVVKYHDSLSPTLNAFMSGYREQPTRTVQPSQPSYVTNTSNNYWNSGQWTGYQEPTSTQPSTFTVEDFEALLAENLKRNNLTRTKPTLYIG